MGDLSPQEIERLILGYEELEGADKTLAHQYFQQYPELSARLKWHQKKEDLAASHIYSAPDFLESDSLTEGDEAAQQESLRLILANLNLNKVPPWQGVSIDSTPRINIYPVLMARIFFRLEGTSN